MTLTRHAALWLTLASTALPSACSQQTPDSALKDDEPSGSTQLISGNDLAPVGKLFRTYWLMGKSYELADHFTVLYGYQASNGVSAVAGGQMRVKVGGDQRVVDDSFKDDFFATEGSVPSRGVPASSLTADQRLSTDAIEASIHAAYPNAHDFRYIFSGRNTGSQLYEVSPRGKNANGAPLATSTSMLFLMPADGSTPTVSSSKGIGGVMPFCSMFDYSPDVAAAECAKKDYAIVDYSLPADFEGSLLAGYMSLNYEHPAAAAQAAGVGLAQALADTAAAVRNGTYADKLPAILERQGATELPVGVKQFGNGSSYLTLNGGTPQAQLIGTDLFFDLTKAWQEPTKADISTNDHTALPLPGGARVEAELSLQNMKLKLRAVKADGQVEQEIEASLTIAANTEFVAGPNGERVMPKAFGFTVVEGDPDRVCGTGYCLSMPGYIQTTVMNAP